MRDRRDRLAAGALRGADLDQRDAGLRREIVSDGCKAFRSGALHALPTDRRCACSDRRALPCSRGCPARHTSRTGENLEHGR